MSPENGIESAQNCGNCKSTPEKKVSEIEEFWPWKHVKTLSFRSGISFGDEKIENSRRNPSAAMALLLAMAYNQMSYSIYILYTL